MVGEIHKVVPRSCIMTGFTYKPHDKIVVMKNKIEYQMSQTENFWQIGMKSTIFSATSKVAICVLLFVCVVLLERSMANEIDLEETVFLMIVANNVNIRESPDKDAKIINQLRWGDTVHIEKINGNWSKIHIGNGEGTSMGGWVFSAYFNPCDPLFTRFEKYVDKKILKYKLCDLPTDNEKRDFRSFFVEFAKAMRKKNIEFLKIHTMTDIYFSYTECVNDIRRTIGTRDLLNEEFNNFLPWWLTVDYESFEDYFSKFEEGEYFLKEFLNSSSHKLIMGYEFDKNSQNEEEGWKIEYGNNWAKVYAKGYKQGIELIFLREDKTWRLIHIHNAYSC